MGLKVHTSRDDWVRKGIKYTLVDMIVFNKNFADIFSEPVIDLLNFCAKFGSFRVG